LEGQLRRVDAQYRRQPDDLAKNVFLANMRDRDEVLFYRLLAEHSHEMLPIVYTPHGWEGDRTVQPRVRARVACSSR
jgi:malate dehydrogenase (oxaloacetate-decarboxylating)